MPDLEELRKRLDEVDRSLLRLLDERISLSRDVAELRLANNMGVMQPAEMDDAVQHFVGNAEATRIDPAFVKRLGRLIVERSCKIERELFGSEDSTPTQLAKRGVRIDHAAIAVRDLDEAIALFTNGYGFKVSERRVVSGERTGMELASIEAGDITLVLVKGLDPQSNVTRYIEKYGPGVQHLAILVDELEDVHTDLRSRNANLLTNIIRSAGLRQSFTRRDSNTGMQLEFLERSNINEFEEDNIRELYDAMDREDVF